MKDIKRYTSVYSKNSEHAFAIKRMETIYDQHQGKADEPHRHDYYTMVIAEDAEGQHVVDFQAFDLAANQVYFISPGQVHQIVEKKRSKGFAVTFSPQFMLENGIERILIEDLFLFNDYGYAPPLSITSAEMQALVFFAEKMLDQVSSTEKFKYQAMGAWLKLLLIRCHSFCSLEKDSNTQKVQASVMLLKKFKKLLEEHFQQWHKVQEYAQQLNVSSDYLNTSIKSLTGKNVKEHIQARIIIAAKRMLRFSKFSNKEIAYALGFSEPANFSQFFKKCTGQSPSKFKKGA